MASAGTHRQSSHGEKLFILYAVCVSRHTYIFACNRLRIAALTHSFIYYFCVMQCISYYIWYGGFNSLSRYLSLCLWLKCVSSFASRLLYPSCCTMQHKQSRAHVRWHFGSIKYSGAPQSPFFFVLLCVPLACDAVR